MSAGKCLVTEMERQPEEIDRINNQLKQVRALISVISQFPCLVSERVSPLSPLPAPPGLPWPWRSHPVLLLAPLHPDHQSPQHDSPQGLTSPTRHHRVRPRPPGRGGCPSKSCFASQSPCGLWCGQPQPCSPPVLRHLGQPSQQAPQSGKTDISKKREG